LSSQETLTQDHDSDFPRTWRFDDDGLRVAGTYVRMDEGPSEYGRKAICVLLVDGEERSLWLSQEALVSKFRDELERRTAGDFSPGEHVVVERAAEKKQSANGRAYWPFKVLFPDAPRRPASEILSRDTAKDDDDPQNEDDDVPF
jgi:hypothetical protein